MVRSAWSDDIVRSSNSRRFLLPNAQNGPENWIGTFRCGECCGCDGPRRRAAEGHLVGRHGPEWARWNRSLLFAIAVPLSGLHDAGSLFPRYGGAAVRRRSCGRHARLAGDRLPDARQRALRFRLSTADGRCCTGRISRRKADPLETAAARLELNRQPGETGELLGRVDWRVSQKGPHELARAISRRRLRPGALGGSPAMPADGQSGGRRLAGAPGRFDPRHDGRLGSFSSPGR